MSHLQHDIDDRIVHQKQWRAPLHSSLMNFHDTSCSCCRSLCSTDPSYRAVPSSPLLRLVVEERAVSSIGSVKTTTRCQSTNRYKRVQWNAQRSVHLLLTIVAYLLVIEQNAADAFWISPPGAGGSGGSRLTQRISPTKKSQSFALSTFQRRVDGVTSCFPRPIRGRLGRIGLAAAAGDDDRKTEEPSQGGLSSESIATTTTTNAGDDDATPYGGGEYMSSGEGGVDRRSATGLVVGDDDTLDKEWTVYVCQSKACLERGAGATLDAFVGLAPIDKVHVQPALLGKAKGKGPNVRCIPRDVDEDGTNGAFEVNNVDSVDKVYRILTKHMGVEGVDSSACECLRWNYRGNEHLEKNEIQLAIDAYDKAIETKYTDQEGIVRLMRATAYLKRAASHKKTLQDAVTELTKSVPDPSNLEILFLEAKTNPSLSMAIFNRVVEDCRSQDTKFQHTKYHHGLYQFALLHAAQDSLRATQLLPAYSKTWLRAGEILSDLWKLKESAQYYERAMELDPTLVDTLLPVIDRLKKRQEFLDGARAYGCSEDTLRLALDVAG